MLFVTFPPIITSDAFFSISLNFLLTSENDTYFFNLTQVTKENDEPEATRKEEKNEEYKEKNHWGPTSSIDRSSHFVFPVKKYIYL